MLNNKLLLVTGVVTLSASFFSGAVSAANVATGSATANILQPIAIVPSVSANILDFGDIVPDSVATADVVLNATTGLITSSGPATTSGTTTAGEFDVSGSINAFYTISVPLNGIVTLTGGGAPMAVKDFTSNPAAGAGSLGAGGAETISIGATLVVGINQVEDTYTGNYDVTVNYQ